MFDIKALIVDDEKSGREVLEELISRQHSDIQLLPSVGSLAEAVSVIDKELPDLIFLDIKLGSQTGFDLFERTVYKEFHVIFVTAYSQYALQAIKAAAVDYLLKPVNRKELSISIHKFIDRRRGSLRSEKIELLADLLKKEHSVKTKKISLPTALGYELIPIEDILYLVADRNYSKVVLKTGQSKLATRHLGSFEEKLDSNQFMRIHKSHIVNVNEVTFYTPGNGGFVKMSDQRRLEVSRRKREQLLSAIGI